MRGPPGIFRLYARITDFLARLFRKPCAHEGKITTLGGRFYCPKCGHDSSKGVN